MDALFPLFIFIAFGAALFGGVVGSDRWKEVATELGLEYGNFLQRAMYGDIEGFRVKVTQQKNHIDISVSGNSIIDSVNLSKEGFFSIILGGRDIEIGCRQFDLDTRISSYSRNYDAEVSALLDSKTRAIVSRVVVGGEAKVTEGKITHSQTNSIEDVSLVVEGLVILARRLTMKTHEIPTRLASNAIEDPVSSVRLRNLTLLQEHYRSSPEAVETSAALLDDSHHSISLAAAMFLGKEGLDVVKEIAESNQATTDVRIKALEHLTARAEPKDMIAIATALLKERDPRLQRMAIQAIGHLRHRPSLDSIVELLERTSVATKLEIIIAIENIGDASAEPALINLLEDFSNRVIISAIETLGKIGTVTAVEPLHALTTQRGFKRPAREAIDSIQSRLGDVESGRLSLAPVIDPDGGLSLAGDSDTAGGLSIDDRED